MLNHTLTLDYKTCIGIEKPDRYCHISKSDINPATGRQFAINPATGVWDDTYFSEVVEPAYKAANPNPADLAAEQTRLRMEAIRPAITSYEASIPEITGAYQREQTRLGAEKQPLLDRYANLLADLTGREQKESGLQATALARTYGTRGIPLESPVYQTNLANLLSGITRDYGVLRKETGLAQEADLRQIDNLIAQITDQSVSSVRAVRNAMAQLQAGQGIAAIDTATQLAEAAQQRQFESRFDPLQKQILERQINPAPEYKTVEFGNSLYNYNPATGALSLLQKQVGGRTSPTQTARQGVLNDAAAGKGLSEIVSKYGSQLNVDDIVELYAGASPHGTPYEDWARKILGLGDSGFSGLNIGQ